LIPRREEVSSRARVRGSTKIPRAFAALALPAAATALTAAGLAGLAGIAACDRGSLASHSIRIQAPPPADTTGRCKPNAPPVPLSRGSDGPTTLRLTYRRNGGGLVCDTIVPLE